MVEKEYVQSEAVFKWVVNHLLGKEHVSSVIVKARRKYALTLQQRMASKMINKITGEEDEA